MTNQKSFSSTPSNIEIPEKWREKFLIKRIGEEDIEITLEERNGIVTALTAGARFLQIGKYTLMLNSIKSIDPKWGADNIPPRPALVEQKEPVFNEGKDTYTLKVISSNIDEIKLYDSIFGNTIINLP